MDISSLVIPIGVVALIVLLIWIKIESDKLAKIYGWTKK